MNDTRVTRWVLLVLAALLLSMLPMSGRATATASTSGAACAGMTHYRNDVLDAGRTWVKGMRAGGLLGLSTQTFDERQWLRYGELAQTLLIDLATIEPPAFAAAWHEAQTDLARLRQNFAVWASLVGFEATAEVYATRVAALKSAIAAGRDTATATCGRFARLIDDWNRLGRNATS